MSRYFSPEIETADRGRMLTLQGQRLRATVRHCYENVPFYREKFRKMGLEPGDIKTVDDLVKLPFTYKQDLRDHYPYGLFAVPKNKVVRIHASSGTTGKMTVVGYTKRDIEDWAEDTARAIVAAGGTQEDYIHISYGYGLFTGGLGIHYGAEKLGATSIPVSSGNTRRQIDVLRDFGSNI
ncbi:MAG TPA: phenylacetate--CoA ligase, partial [Clostridiales bacterium]|nr:phenylacetate--CoA ligase [Clostridiales bacterium]